MEVNRKHNASSTVLATYELVENILSFLDFVDLIRARQVCRHWRSIASRSHVLRHKLFLESNIDENQQLRVTRLVIQPQLNSFEGKERRLSRSSTAAQLNPLLRPSARRDFINFPSEILLRYHDVLRMLSWSEGLWESMLLSIPPPQKVTIRIGGARWSGDFSAIDEPGGVCLGKVRERMLSLLRSNSGLEWKEELIRRRVEMLGLNVHIYEQ